MANFDKYMDPNLPVNILRVEIVGNKRIRNSFFSSKFRELANRNATTTSTLADITAAIPQFHQSLKHAGLFEAVSINFKIQSLKQQPTDNLQNPTYDAILVVEVEEKAIPRLQVKSSFESGGRKSIGCEIEAALRSPFGYGEFIHYSVGKTSNGVNENNLNIQIPHVFKDFAPNNSIQAMIAAKSIQDGSHSSFSSFKQTVKSLICELSTSKTFENKNKYNTDADSNTFRMNMHQSLTAELSLRDEIPLLTANSTSPSRDTQVKQNITSTTSRPILSLISPSSKLAAKYEISLDQRDNAATPSTGKFLSSLVEFAVPPGGAQYLRTEMDAQYHKTLFHSTKHYHPTPSSSPRPSTTSGLVFSLCGSLGVLYPLQHLFSNVHANKRSSVFLSDKYFHSGPFSLRGFDVHGIGPKAADAAGSVSGSDSLGGLTKLSLLAALTIPIPFKWEVSKDMKAMAFINLGSIGDGAARQSLDRPYFGYPRASLGTGLVYSLMNNIRLEATYSIPFVKSQHDKTKPFQLRFGLSIM